MAILRRKNAIYASSFWPAFVSTFHRGLLFLLVADLVQQFFCFVVTPSQGRANGGYTISINTTSLDETFASDDRYLCSFACTLQSRNSTTAEYLWERNILLCTMPYWPSQACLSNVTILNLDTGLVFRQKQLQFLILATWNKVDPSFAPGSGGAFLSIAGSGFDEKNVYTCQFESDAPSHTISSMAFTVSSVELFCTSPRWPDLSFTKARISITDNSNKLYGPLAAVPFLFTKTSWSSAYPLSGSAKGGDIVTLLGTGFEGNSSYSLQFSSISSVTLGAFYTDIASCTAVLTNQIICSPPRWPFDVGPIRDTPASMTLYQNGLVVGKANGQMQFVLEGVGEWYNVDIKYIAPWNLYRSACVNTVVTIIGNSFNTGSTFRCNLTLSNGQEYSAPAKLDGFSSLIFTIPEISFNGRSELVNVSVLDNNGVVIRFSPSLDTDRIINITRACWRPNSPTVLQGPASGGTAIAVVGSGFCYGGNCGSSAFLCQFQDFFNSSRYVYANPTLSPSLNSISEKLRLQQDVARSKIVNDTFMVCVAPIWPFPASITRLLVLDIQTGLSDAFPLGLFEDLSFPSFVYMPKLVSTQPSSVSAAGGTKITVHGIGMDSHILSCVFTFPSHYSSSPVINVSVNINQSTVSQEGYYTRFACLTPAWPVQGGDARRSAAMLSLIQPVQNLSEGVSVPIALVYLPQLISIYNTTSISFCNRSFCFAGIELSLKLCVRGFDVNNVSVFLYFASPSGQIFETEAASANIASSVDCNFLYAQRFSWPYGASKTEISLRSMFNISFPVSVEASEYEFEQLAMKVVNQILPSFDCKQPICWPVIVTISGAGFIGDSTSLPFDWGNVRYMSQPDYRCEVNGSITFSYVVVDSTSQLRCFGSLQELPDFGSALLVVVIRYRNNTVTWYSDLTDGSVKNRSVTLRSVWTKLDCGRSCSGSAVGGFWLHLIGYGFATYANYSGIFISRSALPEPQYQNQTTSDIEVISSMKLRIKVPRWGYEEGTVELLLQDSLSLPIPKSANFSANFVYEASWWFTERKTVLFGSDTNITVNGLAFNPHFSYFASFFFLDTLGNMFVTNSSKIHPSVLSEISFNLTANSSSEGYVSVLLFRCGQNDSCSEVREGKGLQNNQMTYFNFLFKPAGTGVYMNQLMGESTKFWCTSSYPWCMGVASGGATIFFEGSGFRVVGVDYQCNFSSVVHVVTFNAIVLSENTMMCRLPMWPYPAALLTISLWSELSGVVDFGDDAKLLVVEVVDKVQPSQGPVSASIVTVLGSGFVYDRKLSCTYSCRFWANFDSGPYLSSNHLLQGRVAANVTTDGAMTCNASAVWAQFPAATARLQVIYEGFNISLSNKISATDSVFNISSSNPLIELSKRILFGRLILIDNETMKLIDVKCKNLTQDWARCEVNVMRGAQHTSAQAHSPLSAVHSLVGDEQSPDLLYYFYAIVTDLDRTAAFPDDRSLLNITARGLQASYAASNLSLGISSCNETSYPKNLVGQASIGPSAWGITFDVMAKYSLTVTWLQFYPNIRGRQKIWILSRTGLDCVSNPSSCTSSGHELILQDWQHVLDPTGFVIEPQSFDAVNISVKIPLTAGRRLGFLLIGEQGLRFGQTCLCNQLDQSTSCQQQYTDVCMEYFPGQLVLSQFHNDQVFSLIKTASRVSMPYLYRGAVGYVNDEIIGDTYSCSFSGSSLGELVIARSESVNAFVQEGSLLPIADKRLTCRLPEWIYGEQVTNFSLFSATGAFIAVAENVRSFSFFAGVSKISSPLQGSAFGGDKLIVLGIGMQSVTSFACRFTAISNSSRSAFARLMVYNDSSANCYSPLWLYGATKVSVDLVRWVQGNSQAESEVNRTGNFSTYFTYLENWSYIAPTLGAASGNTQILVYGAGFDGNKTYSCLFADGGQYAWNTSIRCINSSSLLIFTPPWGSKYPACLTTVQIWNTGSVVYNVDPNELSQAFSFITSWKLTYYLFDALLHQVQVFIEGFGFDTGTVYRIHLRDVNMSNGLTVDFNVKPYTSTIINATVPWSFRSIAFLSLLNEVRTPICKNAAYSICSEFEESLSVNATWISVEPSQSSAQGGQILTISGSAFPVTRGLPLRCNFTMRNDSSQVYSAVAMDYDASHIYCRTPRVSVAGEYVLTILNDRAVIPLTGPLEDNSEESSFTFTQAWDWADTMTSKNGSAFGGSLIVLYAFGLNRNASYLCMFYADDVTMYGSVAYAEDSQPLTLRLSCNSPLWGYDHPARTAGFRLVQNVSVSGDAIINYRKVEYVGKNMTRSVDGCQYEACFYFFPIWTSLNQSGVAKGGVILTVNGSGFSLSQPYALLFMGSIWISTNATPSSAHSIIFSIPAWPALQETTTARLFDKFSRAIAETAPPSVYSFLNCWQSKTVIKSPARSPARQTIAIGGAGFSRFDVSYQCFYSVHDYNVSIEAQPISTDTLVCSIPVWAYTAGTTTFSILHNGTEIPLCSTSVNQSFVFSDGWYSTSSWKVLAGGNTMLFLQGFGFGIHDAQIYTCTFTNDSKTMNVSAVLFNDTVVACKIPAWGSRYTSQFATISLKVGDRIIDFHNRTEDCASPSTASIYFEAVWAASGTSISGYPRASVLGNASIEISGYGFDPSIQYKLIFFRSTELQVASIPQHAQNTTSLIFTVPAWNAAAAIVDLILLELIHSQPVSVMGDTIQRFTYFAVWRRARSNSLASSWGAIALGASSIIEGFGFYPNVNYTCKFVVLNVFNSTSTQNQTLAANYSLIQPGLVTLARAINISILTFLPSSQSIFAGPSLLSIVDQFNNTVPALLSEELEISCSWNMISPVAGPAKGNTTLSIYGNGFIKGKSYKCFFIAYSNNQTVDGAVVNANILLCNTPAWIGDASESILVQVKDDAIGCVFVNLSTYTAVSDCTLASCASSRFAYSVSFVDIAPKVGIADGTSSAVVSGFGFSAFQTEYCTFISPSCTSVTTIAKYMNHTTLICNAPYWPCAAGEVNLTISDHSASFTFKYLAVLSAIKTSRGYAKGGFTLTLNGAGFSHEAAYFCTFRINLISEMYNCSAANSSQITCNIISWPHAAAAVLLNITNSANQRIYQTSELYFQFVAGWDGIISPADLSGLASGNTSLRLSAYGLDSHEAYSCVFSSGGQMMSQAAIYITSQTLECKTPNWGSFFPSGTVQVSVQTAYDVNLPFTNGGQFEIDPSTCQDQCQGSSFRFLTVWRQDLIGPTTLAAAGGQKITFVGFGFSIERNYSCIMQSPGEYNASSNRCRYVSVTEMHCKAPVWNYIPVADAYLDLLEDHRELDYLFYVSLLTIEAGILNLSITEGQAGGGSVIEVLGFGFFGQSIICEFNSSLQTVVKIISAQHGKCTTPHVEGAAGIVSLRFFSMTMSSAIKIFRVANTHPVKYEYVGNSSLFRFYTEWTYLVPPFADRLGRTSPLSPQVTVRGYGFEMTTTYLCRFTSLTDPSRVFQSAGQCMNASALICDPPEWDLTTSWSLYNSSLNVALIQIFEYAYSDRIVGWVDPDVVQYNDGKIVYCKVPIFLEFVQINTPPTFTIRSNISELIVFQTLDQIIEQGFVQDPHPRFARLSCLGTPCYSLEDSQKLTFLVSSTEPSAFSQQPRISSDGSLSFVLNDGILPSNSIVNSTKSLYIQVSLKDDGMTKYGGMDTTTRSVVLTITNPIPQAFTRTGGIQLLECQLCLRASIPWFLCFALGSPGCRDMSDDVLDRYGRNIFIFVEDAYFTMRPMFDNSSNYLIFQMAPFAFGEVILRVQVLQSLINFTISVADVNERPSFSISTREIFMVERDVGQFQFVGLSENLVNSSNCSGRACFIRNFAFLIKPGPNLSTPVGPRGEDWAETGQQLTFQVTGGSVAFARPPAINSEGKLSFDLANPQHSLSTFIVLLYDDGGTDFDGLDESNSDNFSIGIKYFNHPPSFHFGCPVDDHSINCSDSCAVSNEDCQVEITTDHYCGDCNVNPVCNTGQDCMRVCTTIPSFVTNIMPADDVFKIYELNQNVSFIVQPLDTFAIEYFANDSMPKISLPSGQLDFCLAEDLCMPITQSFRFSIGMVDDGNLPGQNKSQLFDFTVFVRRVNQQPSFDVQSAIIMLWQNSGQTIARRFATNIAKGNRNRSSFDCEMDQSITFAVEFDDIFFSTIYVNSSTGDLFLQLKDNVQGSTTIFISLQDDGDTLHGGQNVSSTTSIVMYVSDSYVKVNVQTFYNISDVLYLASRISGILSVQSVLTKLSCNSTSLADCCQGTGTGMERMLSENNICFCFDECFCNAGGSELNGTNPGTYISYSSLDALQNPSAQPVEILVLGLSRNQTIEIARNLSLLLCYDLSCNISAFARNLNSNASFLLKSEDLVYFGSEFRSKDNITEVSFVYSIYGPPNVPLDINNGAEVVTFQVRPLGRKAYAGDYPWVFDEETGGLFSSGPIITRGSRQECSGCIASAIGNLWFQKTQAYNGKVLFSVQLAGTSAVQNFTISCQLVYEYREQMTFTSPESSNLIYPGFLRTLFANDLDGTTPFDLVLEIRTSNLVSSANLGTRNASGWANLDLQYVLGNSGQQALLIHAGDQVTIDEPATTLLIVNALNYPPDYTLQCAQSELPSLTCFGNCTSITSNSDDCLITINIDQDCGMCGLNTVSCCTTLANVVSAWASTGPSFWDETDQLLDFTIYQADPADNIILASSPSIDARTGNLTLCPSKLFHGVESFRVVLYDDGGTANGGFNKSGIANLNISVHAVNQQPSFQINSSLESLIVWKSYDTAWSFPYFVVNLTKGLRSSAGLDSEIEQNGTFYVLACADMILCSELSDAFSIVPEISASNGTLDFMLRPEWTGWIYLKAWFVDNGGSSGCGNNISINHSFSIAVCHSYVLISFRTAPVEQLKNETLLARIRTLAVLLLNVSDSLVSYQPFPIFQHLPMEYQSANETEISILFVAGLDRESTLHNLQMANSNLSPNILNTLLLQDYNIKTLKFDKVTAFVRNLDASFDLLRPQIVTACNSRVQLPLFLSNVTGPESNVMYENGSDTVEFEVNPIRYRQDELSEWMWGSNGDIFVVKPAVSSFCDPVCDAADLSYEIKTAYNGEVEFNVKMISRNSGQPTFSRNFTLSVGPCFDISDSSMIFAEDENEQNVTIECFLQQYYAGTTNRSLSSANFSIHRRIYFTLFDVEFLPVPQLGISHQTGCLALMLEIKSYWNGNVSFFVEGFGIERNFTIAVESINQPPIFSLSEVDVLENECAFAPCNHPDIIFNIFPGPPGAQDEVGQTLSFQVEVLAHDLFSMGPNVSLQRWNLSTGEWKANFSFQTQVFQYIETAVTINFTLIDSGLPPRNKTSDLKFLLQHVNVPPTFDLVSSNLLLWENSGVFTQDYFAQNISAGPGRENVTQEVTFSTILELADLFVLGREPRLYRNGTIEFELKQEAFGKACVVFVLNDDGDSRFNGSNRSVPHTLDIIVTHVNVAPTLCVLGNSTVFNVDEGSTTLVHSIPFATSISAGDPAELNQSLSFSIRNIHLLNSPSSATALEWLMKLPTFELRPSANASLSNYPCNASKTGGTMRFFDGYINVSIPPFQYATLILQLLLQDDGGTAGGGKNSTAFNISINVRPVNWPPTFELTRPVIMGTEGTDQIFDNVVSNISVGTNGINYKFIRFIVQNLGNIAVVNALCYDSGPDECKSTKACLRLTPKPFLHGSFTIKLAMQNSGCCDGRGDNISSWVTIQFIIRPVNDPPSFNVAANILRVDEAYDDSVDCITTITSTWWTEYDERPGSSKECFGHVGAKFYSIGDFAQSISLGPFEGAPEICPPDILCENQTGTFQILESVSSLQDSIADVLFEQFPIISFPDGRVNFTLNLYACGEAIFTVFLIDDNALDGTSKQSARDFSVKVTPVSHPPDFEIHSILLEEGSTSSSELIATKFANDGYDAAAHSNLCVQRVWDNVSFTVSFDSLELFDAQPLLHIVNTSVFLIFHLKSDAYGMTNAALHVNNSGGLSSSKEFTVQVEPVNDVPTFDIQTGLNVTQSSGAQEIISFAYDITAGPANEREQKVTFIVQYQTEPTLLTAAPQLTAEGMLTFEVVDNLQGRNFVTVYLEDDGIPSKCSLPKTFEINIVPLTMSPSFSFGEVLPLQTKENAGVLNFSDFVVDITSAAGFFPTSEYLFDINGGMVLKDRRIHPLVAAISFASDFVASSDGRHLYVAEVVTNSISIWRLEGNQISEVLRVDFMARISDPDMLSPASIAISADDHFVYVSSQSSCAIASFRRNKNMTSCDYGLLTFDLEASYCLDDHENITACHNGVSTQLWKGIQGISLSGDLLNLYAITFSGVLATFNRTVDTGKIMIAQIIEGQGFCLAGATAVTISGDNLFVFVASWLDEAVASFQRNTGTGSLYFLDCLRNGERLPSRFKEFSESTEKQALSMGSGEGEGNECSSSSFPNRIGTAARASKHFIINEQHFVAVVIGEADPYSTQPNLVEVHTWNATRGSFCLVQTLEQPSGASSVEHFAILDSESGSCDSFLAVGSSLGSQQSSSIIVYMWTAAGFLPHHALGGGLETISTNSIKFFQINDQQYLAVAGFIWGGTGSDSPSVIFRWNRQKIRNQDLFLDLRSIGFEWWQFLPTTEALDVDFATFGSMPFLFITTSPTRTKPFEWYGSNVDVFAFQNGQFSKIQSLPAEGAYDVEAFSLFGLGDFVGVACRQKRQQWSNTDYAAYDTESFVLRWNATAQMLEVYQTLTFYSVIENDASLSIAQEYCFPCNTSSDDGTKRLIRYLRGATGFKFFTSDGEVYLAVAQSVCDAFIGNSQCDLGQSKSAILQFNQESQMFEEMNLFTSMSSGSSANSQRTAMHHYAFRLDTGRAVGWNYFEIEDRSFLIASSLTKGAIIYEWNFDYVTGLKGPSGIAADKSTSSLYVISRIDSALVQIVQKPLFDSLGNSIGFCNPCLQFSNSFSEANSANASAHGFRGLQKVQLNSRNSDVTPFQVSVMATVPGVERLCPDIENITRRAESSRSGVCSTNLVNFTEQDTIWDELRCQSLSFMLHWSESSPIGGLIRLAEVDQRGTLSLETFPGAHGSANISVEMRKVEHQLTIDMDGLLDLQESSIRRNSSTTRTFELIVRPVNSRPIFNAFNVYATLSCDAAEILNSRCHVMTNETTVERAMVFANNVSGGIGEPEQKVSWNYTYDNVALFLQKPELSVVSTQNSTVGMIRFESPVHVYGKSCFNITLHDDGQSDKSFGDESVSYPSLFCLTIRRSNSLFSLAYSSLKVSSNNETHMIQPFVLDMDRTLADGIDDSGVKYWFLINVFEMSDDHEHEIKSSSLFSSFNISRDGALEFSLLNGDGSFRIELTRLTIFEPPETASFNLVVSKPLYCSSRFIAPLKLKETAANGMLIIENAFNLSSLSDFIVENSSIFINNYTNESLYLESPFIKNNSVLYLSLKSFTVGLFLFSMKLSPANCEDGEFSFTSQLTVERVDPVDFVPSFVVYDPIHVVESSEMQTILRVAYDIHTALGGQANFLLSWVASDNLLFELPPELSSDGTLTFRTIQGAFGMASISVRMQTSDSGSTELQAQATEVFTLFVHPLPRIDSVSPRFGPLQGGIQVTVQGRFFGASYEKQGLNYSVSIFIGGKPCSLMYPRPCSEQTVFAIDAGEAGPQTCQIVCTVSQGFGSGDVLIYITDGNLTRVGEALNAFTHAAVFYGGNSAGGSRGGFIAVGPRSNAPDLPSQAGASLQKLSLDLAGPINALSFLGGIMVVAGSFQFAQDVRVGNIFQWDGVQIYPMGRGVDGAVNSIATWGGNIYCGGTFSSAFSLTADVIRCGGLVSWNGQEWEAVHPGFNGAIVTTLSANSSHLFVGGKFMYPEVFGFIGLVSFDGSLWRTVGGGVYGGDVLAIASSSRYLYVGGSFSRAGQTSVSKLASWDGRAWLAMGDYNGDVHSIAVYGESVFVGGQFTMACGLPANYLARFQSGTCSYVGNGVNGAVYSVSVISKCLYLGGLFTRPDNSSWPSFAARLCDVDGQSGMHGVFEAIENADALGPVLSILDPGLY